MVYDLTRGERVPTDLPDADFALTVWDRETDESVYLLDEGTSIGVHEVEHEGRTYRVVCSVEEITDGRRR